MAVVAAAPFATPVTPAGAAAAAADTRSYLGRWVSDEGKAAFSARGLPYRSVDISRCGKDFCGTSVDAQGKCGTSLFRVSSAKSNGGRLLGKGNWGKAKKNVVIYGYGEFEAKTYENLDIYVGDGYDMGGRSGNMPKMNTLYKRTGVAKCGAK